MASMRAGFVGDAGETIPGCALQCASQRADAKHLWRLGQPFAGSVQRRSDATGGLAFQGVRQRQRKQSTHGIVFTGFYQSLDLRGSHQATGRVMHQNPVIGQGAEFPQAVQPVQDTLGTRRSATLRHDWFARRQHQQRHRLAPPPPGSAKAGPRRPVHAVCAAPSAARQVARTAWERRCPRANHSRHMESPRKCGTMAESGWVKRNLVRSWVRPPF